MSTVSHHEHWLQDQRDEDAYRQRMAELLKENPKLGRQTIGKTIATDSGYSGDKGLDYAQSQAEAQMHQLPLHEKPFLSPDDRSYMRDYAETHGVNSEDIMGYERFRREKSYKESTNLQQQLIEAKKQGNFQQQLDILGQHQEHAQANTSPEMTNNVREHVRQYAHAGGDADAIMEWEQYRRTQLPENVEASQEEQFQALREQVQQEVRRATVKKIATRTGLGLGGAALVGGGLYVGSKYGNFSLNPADWFHRNTSR